MHNTWHTHPLKFEFSFWVSHPCSRCTSRCSWADVSCCRRPPVLLCTAPHPTPAASLGAFSTSVQLYRQRQEAVVRRNNARAAKRQQLLELQGQPGAEEAQALLEELGEDEEVPLVPAKLLNNAAVLKYRCGCTGWRAAASGLWVCVRVAPLHVHWALFELLLAEPNNVGRYARPLLSVWAWALIDPAAVLCPCCGRAMLQGW